MTIDELAENIRVLSDEIEVQRLADLLSEWKSSDQTTDALRDTIERYIGHLWLEQEDDHRRIYNLWSSFKAEAIMGIGGMTMNERLYWFGLADAYDACEDQALKLMIYNKVMARP